MTIVQNHDILHTPPPSFHTRGHLAPKNLILSSFLIPCNLAIFKGKSEMSGIMRYRSCFKIPSPKGIHPVQILF